MRTLLTKINDTKRFPPLSAKKCVFYLRPFSICIKINIMPQEMRQITLFHPHRGVRHNPRELEGSRSPSTSSTLIKLVVLGAGLYPPSSSCAKNSRKML